MPLIEKQPSSTLVSRLLIIWCPLALYLNVIVVFFQIADVSCYVPELSGDHKFSYNIVKVLRVVAIIKKSDEQFAGCFSLLYSDFIDTWAFE